MPHVPFCPPTIMYAGTYVELNAWLVGMTAALVIVWPEFVLERSSCTDAKASNRIRKPEATVKPTRNRSTKEPLRRLRPS